MILLFCIERFVAFNDDEYKISWYGSDFSYSGCLIIEPNLQFDEASDYSDNNIWMRVYLSLEALFNDLIG